MFYPLAGRFNLPHHFLKIAAGFLCVALPCATLAQTVNLTVNATQTVRTVDERIFGVNAVMWDPQTSSAQTISLVQAAGIRAIRIPGGSASDDYHWRVNKSAGTSNGGNNTWTQAAGFNSFSSLIANVGTQAFVTVNYGSGTAEEAAAWVAYANASTGSNVAIGVDANGYDWKTAGYWASLRAASPIATDDGMNFLRVGRSSPFALKYWEIGNECYGSWENDTHAAKWDPVTYANTVKSYSAKMKAVDSTIKIGAVTETGEDTLDGMSPVHNVTNPRTSVSHHGWTPVVLATMKSAAFTPDFIIDHRYEQAPKADQPGNPESDAGLLQKAKTWPNDAINLRQMLSDYLGTAAANVEIDVTENNSVYAEPGKQTTSLVNGLYLADSLGNILQTEINSLLWWDLRNGQDNTQNNDASLYGWRLYGDYGILSTPPNPTFAGASTTYYDAYPTYYVMKLLSHFARGGDTVVKASSGDSLLSIFSVHRSDGTLTVLVINKDPTNTKNASIALTGFTPAASATVYSYGIPQDNAAKPAGSGSPDVASSSMAISGATFSASFAPYSATVISLSPPVVNSAPSFTQQPASRTVVAGDNVTLTVTANGTPAPTYQWRRNGVNINGATGSSYTINAVSANTAGSYSVVVTNAAGAVTSNVALLTVGKNVPLDFNGDGRQDILWHNPVSGGYGLWLMNGANIIGGASYSAAGWDIAGLGDFNGDGKDDILWRNPTTGEVSLWEMDGLTITANVSVSSGGTDWIPVDIADFNGDGKKDIVWRNLTTGDYQIWLMDGGAAIGSTTYSAAGWDIFGFADFNGDGKADIVWRNATTGDYGVWLMNGTTILSGAGYSVSGWEIAGLGDFNGDGKTDILWRNTTTGDCGLWLMDGVGIIGGATYGAAGWEVAGVGDFNGDGKSDLLWHNLTTGDYGLWLMDGANIITGATYSVSGWNLARLGDFNGDGTTDVIWHNATTGDYGLWLMDGANIITGATYNATGWVTLQ